MFVTPDAKMIYPLACIVAGFDLSERLPRRGGLTLEDVPAEDVQDFSDRTGVQVEPGECLPPEFSSDTTSSSTVAGQTTTTRTQKTVNADGTVTTTTTTTKPDGTQSVQQNTEPFTPARPAGVLLRVELANGAEFALIRPLTKLRVGDSVNVIENYTDRHALRAWTNAIVHSPPKWNFMAHAGGPEFYSLSLEFLIVGGTP